MKKRYFIKLAYHGKNYHGWQTQDNAITIQSVLNKCFSLVLSEEISIVGCGRTDQGVHAHIYYAHFDTTYVFEVYKDFLHKINSFLPKDIVIYDIFQVNNEANSRFDATLRTYRYFINTQKEVFNNEFSWYVRQPLNVHLMNLVAKKLIEYSDFTSFAKLHSQSKTNICTITEAKFIKRDFGIIFTISANRFLRNMVRAIVGTLVEVGHGKITIDEFINIIESKQRANAGMSAPAHGLFLWDIIYPKTIYKL
ncbi:MAG: tRNA pseudouridine(38-40) synthase TruA [Bacteroidetes bacterium GWE2_29_8]|nr:MAG: tRNA pseudouridine(38-40) synthase TruA [Bacteroidetes bacterium GWE2_29_8]OFY16614.1 MAG: tRNA pseudouridine(38-40) synthase TruA [Bacteroidetes bacterium GWF2_29_10]